MRFYVDYIDWANPLLGNPTKGVVVELCEQEIAAAHVDYRAAIREKMYNDYGDIAVMFLYEEMPC